MTIPMVSLVTVAHNSASELQHFWRDWPSDAAEWIVVDNASTDGSAEVARALGARVIRLDVNIGFSAANNVGAARAEGRILGFLNPDLTPTRQGIDALAGRVTTENAFVAPQLVNIDGTLQENGRNAPYPLRKLAHMFAPTSRLNHHYVRHVESGLEQVVWVMGAALFMSREVFEQVGGWDDQYFIYYEDSDICLRALHLGVPTFVDGDVRWVHGWARQTKTARSLWVWKQEFRSAIRFYHRHPDCIVPRRSRSGSLGKVEGTARP
jgi:N-acetylglucosaminyl-diphospho-decaprenol L-rhamnosyltransferase